MKIERTFLIVDHRLEVGGQEQSLPVDWILRERTVDGDTVNVGLTPGPVRLADLGGGAALPHLVAGPAGDGGPAPEAAALRPHLRVLGGARGAAAQGLTGEVGPVPGNQSQSLCGPNYLSPHQTAVLLWNRHLL